MSVASRTRLSKVTASVVLALAIVLWWQDPSAGADEAPAVLTTPAERLITLGLKFGGAGSCTGSGCHSGQDVPLGQIGNEYDIWLAKDAHAGAYESLAKPKVDEHPEYGQIAQKLGIDATKSNRCLSCHAQPAPANLQGEKFDVAEGNTCTTCHGPSEKYLQPHVAKGWTQQQRDKLGSHAALLKEWGLYDTRPVTARAELCVGCHVAIDAELVKAGHPQPVFELDYYQELENKHWEDPAGYFRTQLWAAGQAVALRDALRQLAARAGKGDADETLTDAYQQAMAHYKVFRPALDAGIKGDAAALDAAAEALQKAMDAKDTAALATQATAAAGAAAAIIPNVEAFKPDKAAATKLMTAIASQEDIAQKFAMRGVEQQAFALYSLYGTYAANEKPGDADAVNDAVAALFKPMEAGQVDAAAYTTDLKALQAKLPK